MKIVFIYYLFKESFQKEHTEVTHLTDELQKLQVTK